MSTSPLTPCQERALRLYFELGIVKAVAAEMGTTTGTVVSYLSKAYAKLGVSGHMAAFRAMGWVTQILV
jgi:DNA-binding CsgD family transcriptional regulator